MSSATFGITHLLFGSFSFARAGRCLETLESEVHRLRELHQFCVEQAQLSGQEADDASDGSDAMEDIQQEVEIETKEREDEDDDEDVEDEDGDFGGFLGFGDGAAAGSDSDDEEARAALMRELSKRQPQQPKRQHPAATSSVRSVPTEEKDSQIETAPSEHPTSFSRVPVRVVHGLESAKQFPLFEAVSGSRLVCELNAGDMLYLPAGWFHEVTSFTDSTSSSSRGQSGGHMAFNYWFHPPDGDHFTHPYQDDFWQRRFQDKYGKVLSNNSLAQPPR